MTALTFKPSRFGGYFVYRDDRLIGHVHKIRQWTVRRRGWCIGVADTRIAAASLLEIAA